MKIRYEDIRRDEEILSFIEQGDRVLGSLGYTEHSRAHAAKVAESAALILKELGYEENIQETARIAGFLHDIGNAVNRTDHAHTGAIIAYNLLKERRMDLQERLRVMTAIGGHDENTGNAIDEVSAALILADKGDVRRTRVRTSNPAAFDAHDKVNFSVLSSRIDIQREKKKITLSLTLDEGISSVMDYFEIFLERMMMCRKAATVLGCTFSLSVNDTKLC